MQRTDLAILLEPFLKEIKNTDKFDLYSRRYSGPLYKMEDFLKSFDSTNQDAIALRDECIKFIEKSNKIVEETNGKLSDDYEDTKAQERHKKAAVEEIHFNADILARLVARLAKPSEENTAEVEAKPAKPAAAPQPSAPPKPSAPQPSAQHPGLGAFAHAKPAPTMVDPARSVMLYHAKPGLNGEEWLAVKFLNKDIRDHFIKSVWPDEKNRPIDLFNGKDHILYVRARVTDIPGAPGKKQLSVHFEGRDKFHGELGLDDKRDVLSRHSKQPTLYFQGPSVMVPGKHLDAVLSQSFMLSLEKRGPQSRR